MPMAAAAAVVVAVFEGVAAGETVRWAALEALIRAGS